jgi:hypothetical protein
VSRRVPGRPNLNGPAPIAGMPLTLRPTGLRQSAAFAHLADYSVYDDGREIGRIYEVHAPTRPEAAWTWSIIVMGKARGHVMTDGNAPTFDEVKRQFAECWERFKAWSAQ